jgi:hypothetical protein
MEPFPADLSPPDEVLSAGDVWSLDDLLFGDAYVDDAFTDGGVRRGAANPIAAHESARRLAPAGRIDVRR